MHQFVARLFPRTTTTLYLSLAFLLTFCLAQTEALFSTEGFDMAWKCTGHTYQQLIANMQRHKIIQTARVAEALLSADRAHYCPRNPYEDSPQVIGYGATISAPHMHAYALEILEPALKPGASVLDVGCGSGILASAFAHMVGPKGKVVGIEHIAELAKLARSNVEKDHPEYLSSSRVEIHHGDGRLGYEPASPYDVIHVGAAAWPLPEPLIQQLKPGGLLLTPLGKSGQDQRLILIKKELDGQLSQKDLMGVIYVPLTDQATQMHSL